MGRASSPLPRRLRWALASAAFLAAPAARAEEPPAAGQTEAQGEARWTGIADITTVPTFLLFAGGALSSLTLHEMGHVTTNLAYGNVPGITGIWYAKFIPWFVIDAHLSETKGVYYKKDGQQFGAGGHGYYVINTAGFMVQNIGSELILTSHPRLRYEHQPFLKGMLWMNILLSLGYSTASLVGAEDPHGDIYGAAQHSGFPHQVIAGVVLSNGVLDMLRYFLPDNPVLPWASRASKLVLFGMDQPFEY